jgi:hypothetical protein
MTSTTNVADLLEALRQWLLANPNGDLEDFTEQYDTTPQELTEAWNTYFAQADFSRNYNLDTAQSGSQGATQAAAQAAPAYTPSEPPPYDASPQEYVQYLTQEVNNYQEFTTINNIEDNSFNQQIIAGGDVNQEIDIDNSEQTATEGGVIIDDSELEDVDLNTGNVGPGGVLQQGDDNQAATGDENVLQDGDNNVGNTGDIDASDGSAVSVGGDATSIGSGNDNFGSGQQATNVAVGDNNKQANQQQDNDTDIDVGDTTGGTASADGGDATGGAGTGGAGGAGGDGGAGGSDLDDFPFDGGGDGGDGGAGGAGGAGTGGSATGGAGGEADASAEVDIDVENSQNIDF